MKNAEQIIEKISSVNNKLERIQFELNKQLALSFFERSPEVCNFLDKEKVTYNAIVQELHWVLNE